MKMKTPSMTVGFLLFMALSIFSVDAISEESFLEDESQIAFAYYDRMPAAALAGVSPEVTPAEEMILASLYDLEFEREWLTARQVLYENVGLTSTEIVWLNEIDDTVQDTERRMETAVMALVNEPQAEEQYMRAMISVFDEATHQKEEFIGAERYQYLLKSRNQLIEAYQIRTGRVLNLRW